MDASYIFLYISSRHYRSVFFFFLKSIKKSFFKKTTVCLQCYSSLCVSDRGYTLYEPIRREYLFAAHLFRTFHEVCCVAHLLNKHT